MINEGKYAGILKNANIGFNITDTITTANTSFSKFISLLSIINNLLYQKTYYFAKTKNAEP